MPIEFTCDACSRLLRVPDGSGGQACQCPICHKVLLIPEAAGVSPAASHRSPTSSSPKLKIACPSCGHKLSCAPALLGTTGQCRNCHSIFTIPRDGTPRPAPTDSVFAWVFNCPKCDQLFAGQPEMEGRKGKCHACGQVFAIALKPAGEPTPPATTTTIAPSLPQGSIRFACRHCQGVMEVPGNTAGRTTQCPYCQQLLKIPAQPD